METKKIIAILMFVFLLLFAFSAVMGVTAGKNDDPKGPNEEQNQEKNGSGECNNTCEGNQSCNCTGSQNQEKNGSGKCNNTCEGNQSCNCTGAQNQEKNGGGESNNSGEQNKEQNKDGGGAQNQEKNGEGEGNGSSEGNNSGEQNKEQNKDGGGAQNQEKNGESNGSGEGNNSGEQNKEQNKDGGGAQNQEKNGEGNGNGNGKNNESEGNYQWRHQYRNQIQQGIENGTIVKECNISVNDGKTYMNSYEFQKGMEVEIEEQNQHRLQIKVSAEYKEGKVLVLNVEKNAFQVINSNQLRIKFDGHEINDANIEDVIDGQGTEAQFAAVIGDDGGQFIIYIPYFSEHTIIIEAIGVTESEAANFILGAVGAAIFTIIIFVLIVVKIGKYRK